MSKHDSHRLGFEYEEVDYVRYSGSKSVAIMRSFLGYLSWPFVLPLVLMAKTSTYIFVTISEFLAVFPFIFGIVIRYEFYRFSLQKCGKFVTIEFGTTFCYPDIEIGDFVTIGKYNSVHHCDFGSYVMTGEGCTFLSGSKNHYTQNRDVPMALQGGQIKRIRIEDDVWIGVHCAIADNVGTGSIIAIGTVVTSPVPEYTLAIGNPARLLPRP